MRKKNDVLKKRNLLVCVDDSDEFMEAINFACNNAEKDKMGLILLHVIEEENARWRRSPRESSARGGRRPWH